MPMEKFLWISSAIAFALGGLLRGYERRRYGKVAWNPKRLSALQVAYTALLAYPFCVAYVWAETSLFR
jgi:hypothetical protein